MSRTISDVFSKNRAEEFPDDVWGNFVLPLDYIKVDLRKLRKAAVIVGGRGSGKTSFIKYHCFPTTLSSKKRVLSDSDLSSIGLYFRPDTSFTSNITPNWLNNMWENSFNSYVALNVSLEIVKFVNALASSKLVGARVNAAAKKLTVPEKIRSTLGTQVNTFSELEEVLEDSLFDICSWINQPRDELERLKVEFKSFCLKLIQHVVKSIPGLEKSIFHVYVDEYENLTDDQQCVVNTWLKHGQAPLLISIAHKKHAQVCYGTKGKESIVSRNDYRVIDLEQLYNDEEDPSKFEILASEILALKLYEFSDFTQFEKVITAYSNIESISERKNSQYQTIIKSLVKPLFPSKSLKDISSEIITDSVMLDKLKKNLISEGLKMHADTSLSVEDFIDIKYPEASIVNGCLLNRKGKNFSPDVLHEEFIKLKNSSSEKYDGWIQNNLFGVILFLYNSLQSRNCPLYAGFNQFLLMSKGNIRHFIELCYQAIVRKESENENFFNDSEDSTISVEIQSRAVKATSTLELDKLNDCGANGMHLRKAAKRIGIIFSYIQSRKSQSEPEVTHFSIASSDRSLLNAQTQGLLNDCLVWSVLFESNSTKNKTESEVEMVDYILHPVLSCKFGISYRKKRKIRLSIEEVETIFCGDEASFNLLLKKYRSKWKLIIDEQISNDHSNFGYQMDLI